MDFDEPLPSGFDVINLAMVGSIASDRQRQLIDHRNLGGDHEPFRLQHMQKNHDIVVTFGSDPWETYEMEYEQPQQQHDPDTGQFLFRREWWSYDRPWELFRPAPHTLSGRRAICLWAIASNKWIYADHQPWSPVNLSNDCSLAPELAEEISLRFNAYRDIAYRVTNYFDLDNFSPPFDISSYPFTLAAIKDRSAHIETIKVLQLAVWSWQGLIRWAFWAFGIHRWMRLPLLLDFDWVEFLTKERLLEYPCVGGVVDWGTINRTQWPMLSWYLSRGIRLDYFLRHTMFYPHPPSLYPLYPESLHSISKYLGNENPHKLIPYPQPLDPHLLRSPSIRSTSPQPEQASVVDYHWDQLPDPVPNFDWPIPPLSRKSHLKRDNKEHDPARRWHPNKDRKMFTYWIFTRMDSTRMLGPKGVGDDVYRYGTSISFAGRNKVKNWQYVPGWPRNGNASFIQPASMYEGVDPPNLPDDDEDNEDDEDTLSLPSPPFRIAHSDAVEPARVSYRTQEPDIATLEIRRTLAETLPASSCSGVPIILSHVSAPLSDTHQDDGYVEEEIQLDCSDIVSPSFTRAGSPSVSMVVDEPSAQARPGKTIGSERSAGGGCASGIQHLSAYNGEGLTSLYVS